MNIRCPGYLNAKSLAEDDVCRADYVDWFFHPALAPHRLLIESVCQTMQFHGDAPVLLVGDVASDSSLLFRFTMRASDRLGRAHQRCEVLLVPRSELPAFLDGAFRARPDADSKEFGVETVGGRALPYCGSRQVRNETLGVYTQNVRSLWFKGEIEEPSPSLERPSTDMADPQKVPDPSSEKKGRKLMCKVLLILWATSCGLGIWDHIRSAGEMAQLRASLKVCRGETSECRAEIGNLRRANSRLQEKIAQCDKWTATRSNFELNKIELQRKCVELVKRFREVEILLARIDETPQAAPPKKIGADVPSGGMVKEQNPQKGGGNRCSTHDPVQREECKKGILNGWGLLR